MAETVSEARLRLFEEVERWQGQSFISDDETHCATWEELADYADACAYGMQRAIRVCQRMERYARRRAQKEAEQATPD